MVKFALGLFFLSCLASQTAMDVSSTLLVVVTLATYFMDKKKSHRDMHFVPLGFDLLFVIWVLVVGIGFLTNFHGYEQSLPDMALRVLEFKWVGVFYIVTAAIIFVKPSVKDLTFASAGLVVACAYAIAISPTGYDPIKHQLLTGVGPGFLFRTGGLYSNPMTLAHAYGFFFCLAAGVFFFTFQQKGQNIFLLGTSVLLCGLTIVLTFTRGVWISVFVALLVMALVINKKYFFILFSSGLAMFGFLYSFWPAFHTRTNYAFSAESYDQMRWNLWKTNWEMIKESPWFGKGYGENTKLLSEYYDRLGIHEMNLISHAHNQYIHLAAGTGMVGLSIFLAIQSLMTVLIFRVYHRIPANQLMHKGLALGCIGAQVHLWFGGLFEANFEHSKVKYVMLLMWAIAVWLSYEYPVTKPQKIRMA